MDTFPNAMPVAGDFTILNQAAGFSLTSSTNGTFYALCEGTSLRFDSIFHKFKTKILQCILNTKSNQIKSSKSSSESLQKKPEDPEQDIDFTCYDSNWIMA